MTMAFTNRDRLWLLALVAITAGACSWITDPGSRASLQSDALEARLDDGIVFLGMRVAHEASMSALFQGPVVTDDAGCLRLDSQDRHTVVWPFGYDFEVVGGAVRILDDEGALVGEVGESFSLGGGEVTSLHDGLGFTDADRELAETHCPGRYWIVGTDD